MMYGHVDAPHHWVGHLRVLRGIQEQTGGFTEFVLLPFVHTSSPIYLAGLARPGVTRRENRAVHALSRIMLHGAIDSIQCSWVKLGDDLCRDVLNGGVNDLGGTLMEETISRMAGADNGSYKTITDLRAIVAPLGRPLRPAHHPVRHAGRGPHRRGRARATACAPRSARACPSYASCSPAASRRRRARPAGQRSPSGGFGLHALLRSLTVAQVSAVQSYPWQIVRRARNFIPMLLHSPPARASNRVFRLVSWPIIAAMQLIGLEEKSRAAFLWSPPAADEVVDRYLRGYVLFGRETGRLAKLEWQSFDARAIATAETFKVPSRLRRLRRNGGLEVRFDQDFHEVAKACQEGRSDWTWLTDDLIDVYRMMHEQGLAATVGTYRDGRLVGGLLVSALAGRTAS